MSLSDEEATGVLTGRVILGAGLAGPGETTVAELEAHRSPEELEKVELRFWERLRAKAEAELGDRFDIRAFHDAVLAQGSVPLPVLEARIGAFIDGAKAEAPRGGTAAAP